MCSHDTNYRLAETPMHIPPTLLQLGSGIRKLPVVKNQTPPPEEPTEKSTLKGLAGGLTGALVDGVGLTGTVLRQTIPFQIKAQKDLWSSDKSIGGKLAWSAGLVAINAAALALSPLIGVGVGAYYGYQVGATQGLGASLRETAGIVSQVNGLMGDTFRDGARKEADEPAPSGETVKVRFLTQDPSVAPPVVGEFPKSMMGDNLSNSRVVMDDIAPFMKKTDGDFMFDPGTPEFQQVQSFVSANLALNMFEKALGRKIPWSFEGPLQVHPHAGEGFNAFYARQMHSINFFDGLDPVAGKTIHGSESLDVTSHEVGHAILDALKPGLMSWFSGIEGPSFHESFGDITAMLTSLQQESVVDQVVAETGGNLRKPNIVARLAEEMSNGLNHAMLHSSMGEDWVMRDANNDLKYQDPATLPKQPSFSMDELFAEPHSFSRVFTGAFWDVLCNVNDRFLKDSGDPKKALIQTRDAMTELMARTLDLSPNRMKRMSQVSQAMLEADQRYFQGRFQSEISQAMQARNLLGGKEPGPSGDSHIKMGDFKDLAAADQWRQQLGDQLPASEASLKAEATWKNDRGETFVRFSGVQEVDLDPRTVTDLGASLTLGFDAQGQMFHTQWEPVDQESIQLARQEVQTWRAAGAILGSTSPTKGAILGGASKRRPMGYALPVQRQGKGLGGPIMKEKVVRNPSSCC